MNLKELIKSKNIRVVELADRLNVSPQTIYYLLNHEKKPSLEMAYKLSKILEVSLDELYKIIKER